MSDAAYDVLRVDGLNKSYRNGRARPPVHAVKDVSFSLSAGEVVALLGPNGAGKTTTIKCICQLIVASSGHVHVHGIDAVAQPRKAARYLAATFAGSRNVDMRLTAGENLQFFAALQGIGHAQSSQDMDALLEIFGLGAKLDVVAQALSTGMLQRLALACCLIKRASILLLDEPTLGLDVQSTVELRALIKSLARREGKTVLISSHDLNTVRDVCDRALVMRSAELVADASISTLVDRFKTDAYELVLEGDPGERTRSWLHARGLVCSHDAASGRFTIHVTACPDGLFGVLDAVRTSDAVLESVAASRPGLEDVLSRLLEEV
jgi:ABC-2 type transport system ATP-binding protein